MIGGCNRCTGAVIGKRASRGTVHGAPRIIEGQCIVRGHPARSRLPVHETRVRATWLCAEIVFSPYIPGYDTNSCSLLFYRRCSFFSDGSEHQKLLWVCGKEVDCEGRESKGSIYPSVVDFGKGFMWEYAGECAGSLLKLRLCTDCGWQENVFWSADSPSWWSRNGCPSGSYNLHTWQYCISPFIPNPWLLIFSGWLSNRGGRNAVNPLKGAPGTFDKIVPPLSFPTTSSLSPGISQ